MYTCPNCGGRLARANYEYVPIFRCEACSGCLVAQERIAGIQRQQRTPTHELLREIEFHGQPDSSERLRCPRCRAMMNKQIARGCGFHLDHCRHCRLTWFDGGELAQIQLAYEQSATGRDREEMRRRLAEMSPERRAELQRHLEKLPSSPQTDHLMSVLLWDLALSAGTHLLGDDG